MASTMTDDLPFASASAIAAAIARREIGCTEVLEFYVGRLERYDGTINAVVVRDVERARARARDLDARATASGPLHGVPMTLKESFDIAGLPTTYGLPAYAQTSATRNALAYERLEAAGAVVFGKTNVPKLLLDWQSYNAVYGVTNNPWDPTKTPGGSSGGAAAALAAGLTALEVGSDIGGSIRVPAHMCGLFGHKPTWGLLPMTGHSLAGAVTPSDISVIGPLARSADDLAVALHVLAGPDPADTQVELRLPPARFTSPAGMRIAVWPSDPVAPTDPEITAQLHDLADALSRRGADIRFVRPPIDAGEAYELFLQLLAAALASRIAPEQLEAARERAAAAAPDDTSADAILDRSYGMAHHQWLPLNERRHVIRRIWQHFFADFDVLLCPAFSTTALAHDTTSEQRDRRVTVDGQTMPYNNLGFWAGIVGAFHLPATVAPLGLSAAGLPIGVQIVGPLHADVQTIAVARILEREWRGFVQPPSLDATVKKER